MTLVQKKENVGESTQSIGPMSGWKKSELLGLLQQTLIQLDQVTRERDKLLEQVESLAMARPDQHDPEHVGKHKQYVKAGAVVTVFIKQEEDPHKRGVVKLILTNSNYHPHGIKVRLQDGSVGRVVAVHTPLPVSPFLPQ